MRHLSEALQASPSTCARSRLSFATANVCRPLICSRSSAVGVHGRHLRHVSDSRAHRTGAASMLRGSECIRRSISTDP
jgi:hypothetical protein